MPFPGFFFDTVGGEIRKQQQDAARQAEIDNEREFQMLSILAQHGSDDIKGVAGAALLDLAANPVSKRPRAGGLKGFLGQTQKSPYLKDVQTALSAAQIAPSGPPSAAMSTNAPVEPGSAPIQAAPATPAAPPMPSPSGPLQPQTMDGMRVMTPAQPAPLESHANPAVTRMLPPPQEPPKIRTLFPTAEEIARNKVQESEMLLRGKLNTTAQVLHEQGATPAQVQDALLGMSGAPRRRINSIPMILTVNGQEIAGSYDPDTDTYEVNGQVVQPSSARRPSSSVPQKRPPIKSVDKNGNMHLIDPETYEVLETIPGVGKPQVPPPVYSGTAQGVDEEGNPTTYRLPRGGGPPAPTGIKGVPRAGVKTEQQKQYEVWLKQVDQNLAALGKNKLTGRATVLSDAQRNAEAAKVTGNPGMTYNELALGAKGGSTPERGGKSGVSKDEFKNFLNDFAKQFAPPPSSSVIQGSGLPPEPRKP